MAKFHIVADTSARLSNPKLWQSDSLTQAANRLVYEDQVEFEDPQKPLQDYQAPFRDPNLTSVLAPSVEQMAAIYGQLYEHEVDQILSLHPSKAVGRSLQNARTASERFLGRCDIHVIDSETISAGLGMLIEASLEAAQKGASLDDAVRLVRALIPRIYMLFFQDDLTFLERHGLITRSQAILGNMLGVIAFLTMEDGRLIPMEKVRNRPKALEKTVEFVAEFTQLERIALLQPSSRPNEDSNWIIERIQALHPSTSISLADYGPSSASLVGNNGLGLIVLESEQEPL
jgi:DegV family protein with EDD domain